MERIAPDRIERAAGIYGSNQGASHTLHRHILATDDETRHIL